MANDKQPITIKKYANRRLYNTGTSAYVTLEDLADMVKKGEDFVVYDAKTGEDITRSVLTQIIFEQEGKNGQTLLPITFLAPAHPLLRRQHANAGAELSRIHDRQAHHRSAEVSRPIRQRLRDTRPTRQMFGSLEEQARKNMAIFSQALSMFSPFGTALTTPSAEKPQEGQAETGAKSDLDEMKRQLDELQKRLEGLTPKE